MTIVKIHFVLKIRNSGGNIYTFYLINLLLVNVEMKLSDGQHI